MFKKLFQHKAKANNDLHQVIQLQANLLQQQKRVVDSLTRENHKLLGIIENLLSRRGDDAVRDGPKEG